MSSSAFGTWATTCALSLVILNTANAQTPVTDLLFNEQWGLHNTARTIDNAPPGFPTADLPNIGTCAEKPDINAGSYTCASFTLPGVEDVDINAPEGWAAYQASSNLNSQEVVIALIDTGIDYYHPDLTGKVWLNPGEALGTDLNQNGIDDGCEDNVDGDGNGYLNDCHGISTLVERQNPDGSLNYAAGDPLDNSAGHGTNMAGVMGAVGNNSNANYHGGIVGVTGLEDRIKIATCQAAKMESDVFPLLPGVVVPAGRETALRDCLWYFYNLKQAGVNIAVINASGGMSKHINLSGLMYPLVADPYLLDTPEMRMLAGMLEAEDIPIVAAAGNNSWSIDEVVHERAYYPASFDNGNIISVAAINNQGQLWAGTSTGRWSVDLLAPGQDILSSVPTYPIFAAADADFVVTHGSSQATAYVSGIIALLRANATTEHLDAASIRRLLMSSGKPLAAGQNSTVSGALVRLADSAGKGALTCNNQLFVRRQQPATDQLLALPTETVHIEVQSYNCAEPSTTPSITVTVSPDGTQFDLYDDGLGEDSVAGDGVYSGSWTVPYGEFEYHLSTGPDTVKGAADDLIISAAIVVDNTDNTGWIGRWWPSIYRAGFYGSNYRYATASSSEKIFFWSPVVNSAGHYRVYGRWPDGPNFASNATFRINHQDELTGSTQVTTVQVNQTQDQATWIDLGRYWFNDGMQSIELSNLNANGTVVADAIMLVPEL